eukprot:516133-Rhodomonas_salina.1
MLKHRIKEVRLHPFCSRTPTTVNLVFAMARECRVFASRMHVERAANVLGGRVAGSRRRCGRSCSRTAPTTTRCRWSSCARCFSLRRPSSTPS